MLRRRSVQAAAAAATTVVTTRHRSISNNSNCGGSSSHLWVTVHGGSAPLTAASRLPSATCGLNNNSRSSHGSTASVLGVPLDAALMADTVVARLTTCLHPSRVLLAPHGAAYHGHATAAPPEEDHRGPYEVTVDEVLLPAAPGGGGGDDVAATVHTVADLVGLLVDPDLASSVERVSLRDFASMTEKRKLKAVGGDSECLDVLLHSERLQSEQDARALRLLGVATVGQWKEQPDRVPLSAYGRGVLESAYHRLARHRQQSQKDEVVAWLTRAIQRAVADELMAPKRLSDGVGGTAAASSTTTPTSAPVAPPFLMNLRASAVSTGAAAAAAAAPAAPACAAPAAEAEGDDEEVDHDDTAVRAGTALKSPGGGSGSAARQRRPAAAAAAPSSRDAGPPDVSDGDVEQVLEEVLQGRHGGVEDAEMAKLMAEAEAILGQEAAEEAEEAEEDSDELPVPEKPKRVSASAAAAAVPQPPSSHARGSPAASRTPHAAAAGAVTATPAAVQDEAGVDADEGEEEEDEEVLVEEEEIEEEAEEEEQAPGMDAAPVSTSAAAPPSPAGDAAAAAAAAPSAEATAEERRAKLTRLAELMLKQFNTADGYLHPTNKAERALQEQRGDILIVDEDTAQVDPLAMFSAYHAATVTESDPVGVRALKTIWTSYNKHQMALEEATSDEAAEFYKRESVNALLYGSVLLRALAREEPVVVLEGTPLPPYGFPLLSSDTRSFSEASASASSSGGVTDMTPGKVPTAMQAYKALFNSKEKRYAPFRPAVDKSAGCSVVRLSGTTLHLYYTSMKDYIMEEEVRLPFAEVMLGILHLLRHKVLPRINVVHYHLIATKLADPGDNTDFMLRSTATIDLTNPFTKEEVVRLRALATPLGMADEMEEYRCIDDLVMEIEETSGASVVHSLLHNREDLEATLTATLAQLLPEDGSSDGGAAEGNDGDADDVEAAAASGARANAEEDEDEEELVEEEEEDEEEDADGAAAAPAPSRKHRHAAAAPPAAAATRGAEKRRAVEEAQEEDSVLRVEEDDDEEEQDGDAEEAPAPPPQQQRGKPRQPAPPTAPTARRAAPPSPAGAATKHAKVGAQPAEGEDGEAEGELEEAIYSQLQERKTQQQQRTSKTAAPAKAAPAAPTRRPNGSRAHHDADALEDDEGEAEEVEGFEEDEEELAEEEEVVTAAARTPASPPPRPPPPPPPAAAAVTTPSARAAPAAGQAKAAGRGTSRRSKPFIPLEVDSFEEDEVEEKEVMTAPVLPRAPAGRRAVPVAAAAAAAAPSASPPTPPAAVAPRRVAVQAEDLDEGDENAADVPQVRTRRGAGRRTTGRGRAPPPAEEAAATYMETPPVVSVAAAGEEEDDQWFRKRPKRRYFE